MLRFLPKIGLNKLENRTGNRHFEQNYHEVCMKLFSSFISCGSNVANFCIMRVVSQYPETLRTPIHGCSLSPCFCWKIILYFPKHCSVSYQPSLSLLQSVFLSLSSSLCFCLFFLEIKQWLCSINIIS